MAEDHNLALAPRLCSNANLPVLPRSSSSHILHDAIFHSLVPRTIYTKNDSLCSRNMMKSKSPVPREAAITPAYAH